MKLVSIQSPLLFQLRQFGLDARDWNLVKQNERDYLIRSKIHKSLALRGRVHRCGRTPRWDFIDLYSV